MISGQDNRSKTGGERVEWTVDEAGVYKILGALRRRCKSEKGFKWERLLFGSDGRIVKTSTCRR